MVELATALVALLVFVLAWNTRHIQENRYLLFIGIASLSSGILILAHSLASTGMAIFPVPDADRSTQFWIASRYLLSISFLLAPLFVRRRLHTGVAICVYVLFTFLLVSAVATGWFPQCYQEGTGMTLFKISSEYAIFAFLAAALLLLYRARVMFNRAVYLLMSGSIVASMLSALSYTRHVNAIGTATLAGHFFELFAAYLVYRAVVVTGVVDPSSLLFSNLKQSEERLRRSEERYRSLIELSPDAILVHCDWKVVYCNTAGANLFGAAGVDELINRNMLDLVHHADRDLVRVRIQNSYEHKTLSPLQEVKVLRLDGWQVHVETTAVPTLHEGKPASQVIIRDITERKQAEHQIEHLASFPRLNPNPVLEVDRSGTITFMNEAAVSILRQAGIDDARVFFPPGLVHHVQTLSPGGGNEVLSSEVELAGRIFAENIYLSPALSVARIYAIDITDQKRAEDELRQHRNMLEELVEARTAELKKVNEDLELEIVERKESERRVRITNDLLQLFTRNYSLKGYLDAVVELVLVWSGCRCVGIRITDDSGHIPYVSSAGFTPEFLLTESGLSLSADQCACTRIIAGTPEPQDLPVLTSAGSFYANNSMRFVEGLTILQQERFRGVCIRSGFTSIAVIPIRYRDRILGAIHLADERENMVALDKVKLIEQLALIVGEAVYRFGIEEERTRLAAAVEAAADAVVITDPSTGIIQYANAAFEHLTGYTKTEVLGRTLNFLESGMNTDKEYAGLREALARDGFWSGKLMNRKKDGSLYFEECTVSLVRDKNGDTVNYVYLKRDMTEKLRLESIAESVSTMDSIGSVFAGVRHEIGNPVNSINMILGILRAKLDALPPESVKDYLAKMTEQIGRVEYILRSLKSFNLFETQVLQNVDIALFMENFLPLVRDDFDKRGITLETVIEPGVTVRADPRALQQVLLNLFTNAADAVSGNRQPTILTSVSRSGGAVSIRVQDNGKGIPPEHLKDIFKPFYTTRPHGTGLGLVIVKKMLATMNGTIAFESRVDAGTVVVMVIPEGTHEER